ncbi:MAG: T9SS type A sorting domain-containing protein [Balneolaceae bacterium]
MKLMYKLIFILFLVTNSGYAQSDPDFWMGTLFSVDNTSAIYAEVNDEMYQLIDQEWEKAFDLPYTNHVQDFQIDKKNNYWVFYQYTIMHSDDNGQTWNNISQPNINVMTGHPFEDYMYLKTSSTIYRLDINATGGVWDLMYDEGFEDFTITEDSTIYISKYDRNIIKSTDDGDTWIPTKWKDMNIWSTPGELYSRGDKIYVGTFWDGSFYSTDGGDTWNSSAGLPEGRGVSEIKSYNNKVLALVEDQQSTLGLFLSTDGGGNFEKLNTGLSIWSEQWIDKVVIQESNLYISAGYRGFFYSGNNGSSWEEINNGYNNLRPHHVKNIEIDSNGNIWTILGEKSIGPSIGWGIMKSADNGDTWMEASYDLADEYMTLKDIITTPNGNVIVSGYDLGTIHRSTDEGESWSLIRLENVISTIGVLEAKDSDTLYGGTYWDGVLKSTDGGQNWDSFNNGIPDRAGVKSILVVNDDTIYAILGNQEQYIGIYSQKDGEDWEMLTSHRLSDLAALGDDLVGYFGNNVFISQDGGVIWDEFTDGIPNDSFINALLVIDNDSPGSTDQIILIATSSGIYKSNSETMNFEFVSDIKGNSFAWNETEKVVIVGYEKGIHFLTLENGNLVSTENESIPDGFFLNQNYPNPFNPTTNINFELPKASEVRLEVYDMVGRKVASLVNERKAAGRYTVRFEAGNLSSGMYIYRIDAGNFVQTRKLMLIK